MPFTHLHVHTAFSLLDGSGKVGEMAARVKELGMEACAITDHGSMYGVIDFYRACRKEGIKPIIGCEIYVTNGSMYDREVGQGDDRYYHLVLLAENNKGYENLMKIVSLGFIDGFYYKPRVDYAVLEKYSEGLIALSACLAGIIPRFLMRGMFEEARKEALRFRNIFGEGNFFLELQDHGLAEQKAVNQNLLRLSQEENIPLVCTNDIHYTFAEDADAHDVLLCIQTGKHIDDESRMRYEGGQYYIKSPEEMAALFPYAPEAIANTARIAERCNVEIEFGVQKLPKYDVPEGFTAYEYLEKLCLEGLARRYPDPDAHMERLYFELNTIKNMGYVDYFLIVWDFINYAKSNDIIVGPGRGSAAGSIVSYCLAITDIDPIRYSLIFERFLNPERVSMPDIDVDFCYERRHEVIEYVTEKYGRDCVAQIITFGTMAARNAVKDVGRVLNMPYGAVDSVAKMIPQELNITIDKALVENSELKRAYDTDAEIKKLIDMARRLEGLPRHSSMHAAGVVIGSAPIMNYVPLARGADGSPVTQFVMTTLEELGLLKMDFLGLKTLTVIQNTVKFVQQNTGNYLDLAKIDYDDAAVYEPIGAGRCAGIFQLESAGMSKFMRELKPGNIEDVIAGIALYRPGPMDFIPKYIAGKMDRENIVYDCPQLKPILEATYGCIVYQEQVMQIVRDLAGYSLGGADVLRRAMSKKKDYVMQAERKRFVYGDDSPENPVPGCIKNGINEQVANKIYDDMIDFAKYAFNKSHAAAYAIVAYQTAFLKYYYPTEYMASLMTSVMSLSDKLALYTAECRDLGIELLAPDINLAGSGFTPDGSNIRYGLSAIKGVGKNIIDNIISERESGGPFKDLHDFCERLAGKDINKRVVEGLIKAGALDSFGLTRKQLIHIYMDVLDEVNKDKKSVMAGQISFMDLLSDNEKQSFRPQVRVEGEYPKEVLLEFEKEVTGIYISGHPLNDYMEMIDKVGNAHTNDFLIDPDSGDVNIQDQAQVTVGGIITAITPKNARNGQPMAFLTLEDIFGTVEVIVFPKDYAVTRQYINTGAKVFIKGRATVESEANGKIIASKVIPFEMTGKQLWVRFKNIDEYRAGKLNLEAMLKDENNKGNVTVGIFLNEEKQRKNMPPEFNVNAGDSFIAAMKEAFGDANVALSYTLGSMGR